MIVEKVVQQENGYFVNDKLFIPFVESNSDYQQIQRYLENGGIALEQDAEKILS